jgi:hypothetical protein
VPLPAIALNVNVLISESVVVSLPALARSKWMVPPETVAPSGSIGKSWLALAETYCSLVLSKLMTTETALAPVPGFKRASIVNWLPFWTLLVAGLK